MSRETKQRNIESVSLSDKTATFIGAQCERLNISPSSYINDLIVFAMRQQRELNQCPESYIAVCRDGNEINELRTHLFKENK